MATFGMIVGLRGRFASWLQRHSVLMRVSVVNCLFVYVYLCLSVSVCQSVLQHDYCKFQ